MNFLEAKSLRHILGRKIEWSARWSLRKGDAARREIGSGSVSSAFRIWVTFRRRLRYREMSIQASTCRDLEKFFISLVIVKKFGSTSTFRIPGRLVCIATHLLVLSRALHFLKNLTSKSSISSDVVFDTLTDIRTCICITNFSNQSTKLRKRAFRVALNLYFLRYK